MKWLQFLAFAIIGLYFAIVLLIYLFQTRFIFLPEKLSSDVRFSPAAEEVTLRTEDGVSVNALYFPGESEEVILYFHGNAGNLKGWQFVAEDFLSTGAGVFIIDYRGYGKSSGTISERGFYRDADAAYHYLTRSMRVDATNIIIYGRSIGTGVAIDLASRMACKGVVLEAAYTSLGDLADEKLPFFFPSLYLRFRFDNTAKINNIKSPVIFVHGTEDTLIPPAHSEFLYKRFEGKKELVLIRGGSHNNLNDYNEYRKFIAESLPSFF